MHNLQHRVRVFDMFLFESRRRRRCRRHAFSCRANIRGKKI